MKVSNQNSTNGLNLTKTKEASTEQVKDTKATKHAQAAQTPAAAQSTANLKGSAQVDVSNRAKQIQKAKELATPSKDVDEAKVARLQKMIDEGKYKVDADAIADRMLDEHLRMS